MSVCRSTSRIYCDALDIDGVLAVLGREMEEGEDPDLTAFLEGAYCTLFIFRHHERVETQADFMPVLMSYYRNGPGPMIGGTDGD